MKKGIIFIVLLTAISLMGCENNQTKGREELDSIAIVDSVCDIPELSAVLYDEDGRMIFLTTSDGSDPFICYVQDGNGSLKTVNVEPVLLCGVTLYQCRYGDNIFIVGDHQANSNGWTVNYTIHRLNVKTLKLEFIENAAAVHFEKNGFKIARCRLTNPEASCTADQIWLIHNCYYTPEGERIKEDSNEYMYYHMEEEYGEDRVNAERVCFE